MTNKPHEPVWSRLGFPYPPEEDAMLNHQAFREGEGERV